MSHGMVYISSDKRREGSGDGKWGGMRGERASGSRDGIWEDIRGGSGVRDSIYLSPHIFPYTIP